MMSQTDEKSFSLRIVSLDYYMAPPLPEIDICYSSFQGGDVTEVPVIRIYGSTLAGQKTCLHVHRALPYLYVPCSDASLQTPQEGRTFSLLLSRGLENALKFKSHDGSKKKHVHGCNLVRARRFYGHYSSEELFVKIYLYYPHEVARAATLLLGGAVLNRSFQPHESHIPYLLHFLVDYNLYGMGHLHLSKVKFRHPLQDYFIPRAVRYRDECRHGMEKFCHISASFKADSCSEACRDPAIWLSSTIPSGWMWPFPAIFHDGSLDHHLAKRQSTCDLEGDATVDEILNQQFKMYTSLSQTRSEVKMVQSLVPIWEEEYERTGMLEMVKSPDPSKPLPEHVLKTFLDGTEYQNALMDLCTKAQNSSSQVTPSEEDEKFIQSIKSSNDKWNVLALGEKDNTSNLCRGSFKCPKEENKKESGLSRGSLSKEDDDAIHSQQADGVHGFVPGHEKIQSCELIGNSDLKVVDSEALGLLSWLASSQAVDDVGTDDEVAHEAILSPLLPTISIEKVLEKAHLDYESESQQECQDILDSVEDIVNFEGSKKQGAFSVDHGHLRRTSSDNVIPQVDGSGDEQISIREIGKLSEIEMNDEFKRSSSHRVLEDAGISLGRKHKRKKPLWGSLPLLPNEKGQENLESILFISRENCANEMKADISPSSSAGNEVDKSHDTSIAIADAKKSGLKQGTVLNECSVRDLMRRKRCYQVEPSENESHNIEKIASGKEQNKEISNSPERVKGHLFQNDGHIFMPSETSGVKALLTNQQAAVQDRQSCIRTCKPGLCSQGYIHGPACSNFPRYGKLTFSSCTDSSLQANTFLNQHSDFHERHSDRKRIGASDESESSAVAGLSLLHAESGKVPESFNSEQKEAAACTGCFDCCKVKQESDICMRYSRLVTSDVQSLKSEILSGDQLLENDNNDFIDEGLEKRHTVGSSCVTSLPAEGASLCKDNYIYKCNQESRLAAEWEHEMRSDNHVKSDAIYDANALQIENYVNGEKGLHSFSSGTESVRISCSQKNPVECIEMTFSRKPPIAKHTDGIYEDSFNINFLGNMDNYDGKFDHKTHMQIFEMRDADDFLPFFMDNHQERKLVQYKSYKNEEIINFRHETVLGVPTHYQNDGSFLYLLTPAFLPPSFDCVNQWLLQFSQQNTANSVAGTSRENLQETLLVPSSLEFMKNHLGSIVHENDCQHYRRTSKSHEIHAILSADHRNPQGCLDDVCHGALPISILDQSGRENSKNAKMKSKICCEGMVTTELQSEVIYIKEKKCTENLQEVSQISGPGAKSNATPLSQSGFRDPASVGAGQQLTLLSIEVQAESRGDLRPDPRFDAINLIALAVQEDNNDGLEVYVLLRSNDKESPQRKLDGVSGCRVLNISEEKHLLDHFVKFICSFDPDILMGWDIQGGSLGFLAERAAHLGIGLLKNISRTALFETKIATRDSASSEKGVEKNMLPEALIADSVVLDDEVIGDEWGRTHASGLHVGGRIVLNIWRIMRAEVKLNMYTMEAVAEAVLRRKIPLIPCKILAKWFSSGPARARFRCIEHVIEKAKLNFDIMNRLDMINRTSELARVFGIDFFSVLSRGSQYRVESMLLRLAHTQNYLAISPGNQQVASQPAMECLPLVMEPESGFYADPVVVLDFQSLYPSMIIAYNLCFCTCLGKVMPSKPNTLGVSSFSPDPLLLMALKHQMLLAPNGVMYMPSQARKGVLPRLLEEILSTRIMVKQAMKKLMPSQHVLHRIFNARQLALKLIANVTYGYTAAGFSGRMPCAELADSIVQCGRRTLEKAISFVNAHDKWNARVIYGDTDSMFVLLKGRTVKEAFGIGQDIATAITAMNPNPVALKMEKVYHPCFLLTKKRYVGYSYESPDQVKPTFDAKGIETVRRDTCAAVAKTLEQSLRVLFESRDISNVKVYLERQWTRILCGRVSLQDFVFAKEVRLGTYSSRACSLPPAAIVATKAMRADPRAEPRYGERIAYVVIHGEPGARLIDMVVDPLDLLEINSPYRLNDLYYINKQIIPALQRVFGLLGADLNQWFNDMPRPVRPTLAKRQLTISNAVSAGGFDDNKQAKSRKAPTNRTRIDNYYISKHCSLCGELVHGSTYLCEKCSKKGSVVAAAVVGRTSQLEREIQHLTAICRHCGGGDWIIESGVKCTSLACPVFYERRKVQKELQALSAAAAEGGFYPRCIVEWF